ncbi:MAG: 16S rRNA (cytidine(1402)-2'-O)-methyltransferase [Bacteroidales bacterium]|nr:16S rRNA (cytidine(1402)-2'-O)-methyltransferase [Bacteroidales bacterium]
MSKLYLVPTPIGNLEDITFRAVRILKEVDVILAEDIRNTKKLLNHYGISTRMESHHKFNEHRNVAEIAQRIKSGENFALVSDAGTPAISDPGYLLINECMKKNVGVECLPGATALIPALVNSGLPGERFCFEGFLPHKKGRKTRIFNLAQEQRTIILYESPHRLLKTLQDLQQVMGNERVCSVSREMTKVFEETIRGNLSELAGYFSTHVPRGEIVVVIAPKKE